MNLRPLALLAVAPALVAADMKEEILVIVNNHAITRKTFQQAVEQEHAALYRQFSGKELDEKLRDGRGKTLQGLVDAKIIEDKAADLGMAGAVSDEYLRSIVDGIKKDNNFATDADLERALRGSLGIGLPEFMARQRQQILQQEVLRREVYAKIAIEEQELAAYYRDHKEEYRLPNRFRIRELVLAKAAGPDPKEVLAKVLAELKAGKAFEELVKAYSSSPSKATGGDLGWVSAGFMRKEIEDAAFKLKPGEVSEPLETDKDIYLIQAIEIEKDTFKSFQDVKDALRQKLQEPKAENAIEHYMQALRVRANIRFLVPKADILKG